MKKYAYFYTALLLYIFITVYSVFKDPPSNYNHYRVDENSECSDGGVAPASLSISKQSLNRIYSVGRVRVVLHKKEGCIRRGAQFNISGENSAMTVAEVFLVPFKNIDNFKKKHLIESLKTQTLEQLNEKSFYLLDLEILNRPTQ